MYLKGQRETTKQNEKTLTKIVMICFNCKTKGKIMQLTYIQHILHYLLFSTDNLQLHVLMILAKLT